MSLDRRTYLVLACLVLAALGWVFATSGREGRATIDPRDKSATMPDPRGRALFPEAACIAPSRPASNGPSPRCVVSFERALTFGLAPDGTLAITALAHAATVGWILPAAVAGLLFEPLPADEEARVILVDDAGSRALFAVGSQLWRYDTRTGHAQQRIDNPGGMIEDLAWTRGGSVIAVVAAADGQASLLAWPEDGAQHSDASDTSNGTTLRPLSTQTRAVHVALDRAGERAAVATETGEIAIFDLASSDPPRVATPSLQPAAGIAFVRDHLLVAGSDGVLRALDPSTARETARVDTGSPLVHLAVAADGQRAATAARDHVIRVHALPDGDVTAELSWHQANVAALGFGAGSTLVSADNDGELAVWDLDSGGRVDR